MDNLGDDDLQVQCDGGTDLLDVHAFSDAVLDCRSVRKSFDIPGKCKEKVFREYEYAYVA